MSYCSKDNLRMSVRKIVELTDDEQLSTDPTDLDQSITDNANILTRLTGVITDADAIIDGHIRAHYDVPLSTTPALVRKISENLVRYWLYDRRSGAFDIPEDITRGFDWAMEQLKAIRKGEIDLGVEPPPTASTKAVADTDGPDRLFTSTTMENF